MKKHHKADGGKMEHKAQETPESGAREWEEDEKDKPEARTNAKKIDDEAEERKAGGKVAKKVGGALKKKVGGGVIKKNVGGVTGSTPKASAARAPRKSGGRTGSDGNPFSSARAGTPPKGHKTTDVD